MGCSSVLAVTASLVATTVALFCSRASANSCTHSPLAFGTSAANLLQRQGLTSRARISTCRLPLPTTSRRALPLASSGPGLLQDRGFMTSLRAICSGTAQLGAGVCQRQFPWTKAHPREFGHRACCPRSAMVAFDWVQFYSWDSARALDCSSAIQNAAGVLPV